MRMKLKNKEIKIKKLPKFKKIEFSSKNLFIFLIALFIISFITGIIFFILLNSTDKNNIINFNNYLNINNSTNYITLFRNRFLENTFNIFLIWILGLSVIGMLVVIVLYFFHGFSLGFIAATIISKYKIKGFLGVFCYLFPSKLIYLVTLFILSFFSIKISYKILKLCFSKSEITIKKDINKYFKILVFSFIISILISLLEVFIDPFFIKIIK